VTTPVEPETAPVEMVRVRHGAVAVPGATAPNDRVQYRIFHPALFSDAPAERQTGQLPPDPRLAPWAVVVLLSGINVGAESYRWLGERLAPLGIATVTCSHVGEITPGDVGLSPGLDLSAVAIGDYGTRPSATALGPILEALASEHDDGPLAGMLDLERVAIGGHSAGGTIALLNADPAWFPGVRAAFSYAGHTVPAAMLGHPAGTVLPIAASTPALIIGGTEDGVVAASASRYEATSPTDAHDPVTDTYLRGATAVGSALAVIAGAGHLAVCDPIDPTTARGFLEPAPSDANAAQRELIGSLIAAFCVDHLDVGTSTPTLVELSEDPLLTGLRIRGADPVGPAAQVET